MGVLSYMKDFQAGHYVNQGYYKAFIPKPIFTNWEIADMEVIQLLSKADRHLGRLDMYSAYVDINLYISMHIAKEATQSSRIEGTQTNIEEAFMKKSDVSPGLKDDWEEVQNYIKAMNLSVDLLQELPFSSRLIREIHRTLMQGVRGSKKMPGALRTSQNWIGGATLDDATFVPPPHTYIPELMSDLEKFASDELAPIPDLIKIALIHYQFETIHPFLDGNGRVGRLLITLYLVSKGILHKPILYLSDFFERHRLLYYDNLTRVRTQNDINQWYKFFLTGVIETAKRGIKTFDGILRLQRAMDERLESLGGRSKGAKQVLEQLFKRPVTDADQIAEIIGKSKVSAYKLMSDLEEAGILVQLPNGGRAKMYAFKAYLDLFNE